MPVREPIRILLIEDNADHAELAVRSLDSQDFACQVTHLCDGEEAVGFLSNNEQQGSGQDAMHPHLILLDLRLPKIDGLDVLRRIKELDQARHIPVVVLTTSDAEMDLAKAYQLKASSYLVKPMDPVQFARVISDLGFC